MSWFSRRRDVAEVIEEGVLQMPGRSYPAAVIQGDTLASWRFRLTEIAKRARDSNDDDLRRLIDPVLQRIEHVYQDYNRVCKKHGRGGFE
jgi:hypothetical protein